MNTWIDGSAGPRSFASLERRWARPPELVAKQRPATPLVVLTFDDGASTDGTWVMPMLGAKGVPGTFCIITGTRSSSGVFPFSWQSLIDAQAAGHEIVCHSRTHVDLRSPPATPSVLASEITGAYGDLASHGLVPQGFCWPGNGNDAACRAVARQNMRFALGNVVEGNNTQPLNTYTLARNAIVNGRSLASYTAKVDQAIANNELCIFLTHSFTTDATQQANLAALIDYCQTRVPPVPIVTASAALDLVGNLVDIGDLPGGDAFFVIDGGGRPRITVGDERIDIRKYGAKNDFATDNIVAFERSIADASSYSSGGGFTGRPIYVPMGGIYGVSRSINKKNVPIESDPMRGAYVAALPSFDFATNPYVFCNWDASDYKVGDTDRTLPPATTFFPTYYHQITGLHIGCNGMDGVRGICLVHMHETSFIRDTSFSAPGAGSVAIRMPINTDGTGTINGLVYLEGIVVYGGTKPWAQELWIDGGGSGVKIDGWTTAPGVHSASVFDFALIDIELKRLHCEAYVDFALAANTDLAIVRLRSVTGGKIIAPVFSNSNAANVYKHPAIFADNTHGSGFGVSFVARDVNISYPGSFDPAVPLIKDRAQSGNPFDVMYDKAQSWVDLDPVWYKWFKSSTGESGAVLRRQYTTAARPSAVTYGRGALIYDSTIGAMLTSDGAAWRDGTGAPV